MVVTCTARIVFIYPAPFTADVRRQKSDQKSHITSMIISIALLTYYVYSEEQILNSLVTQISYEQ